LQEADVLLSCGPVALAVRLASQCTGLRRVVCVSSSSIYTKIESPNEGERRLVASIVESENTLKRYCNERGIALVLLRPTLIYGCGLDRNISLIARLARRFHFIPVAGKAAGLRQPLHADDLAALLVSLLEADVQPVSEYPVAGGSIITYREMVERIFIAIGQTPRIAGIPPGFLATLVRAFSWLFAADGLNAETVNRQNRDLVFDDSRLRREVGFCPRRFEPVKDDFHIPAEAMMLQPSSTILDQDAG